MSNNFDLRKFLTENKLTSVAKTTNEADNNAAFDKLNLTGVNSEINNAKSFAKALVGLANKLGEKEGFNPESNPNIKKAMQYLKAASEDVPQEKPVNEYEHHYKKVGGECRKYNDEGDYTVVSMHYCQYGEGKLNESGGYVEVMGDDFDEAVDQIVFAWEQWKNGPATEPEDIAPAKADVLEYIGSLLK
ncbi:MAG: hypothetical protein ACO22Y_00115 [Sediminibacterium sp.]